MYIYTTLISNIKDLLDSVEEVNVVYGYPVSRVNKYPAVVFLPDSYESDFETANENLETRRFKILVIIGATQTNLESVFTDYLPKVVDAIRTKFAANWDAGEIGGHRGWYKVDSGQWNVGEGQDGLEAWCELYLEVKLLTNN